MLIVIVHSIEKIYRKHIDDYFRSPGFAHDVAYWFYYRTGLHYFLYTTTILTALDKSLSFLDLKLASSLPVVIKVMVIYLAVDFVGYWAHRAQHHFKVLWVFHTTHHSQEQLSIFTGARFHPVDTLWLSFVAYIPWRMMGGDAQIWPGVAFLLWVINILIHSRIPWGYGPFYKVFVSPNFHAYHHSTDPAHYNKNFSSGTLSIWDYIFGTAVTDTTCAPAHIGLTDIRPATFWDTLIMPFKLLFDTRQPATNKKNLSPRS